MSITIDIPYNYVPRPYQMNMFNAVADGYKRVVCIWHRRAGKDKTLINMVAREMVKKVGAYYYFYPTYQQGKKALWHGIDKDGFRFIDHIPKALRKRVDNTEMLIELINGSIFQIIGTDNYDTIMGTNPVGCVFSEYSLQNPMAWEYIRPILVENNGWAVFNYTPRGENHGYDLKLMAERNKDWFYETLTVDETFDLKGNPIITKERIEQEKRDGMSDEMIQQEFYCSFSSSAVGAYYANYITQAYKEGRIGKVESQDVKVDTAWDLGIGDSTAIWFSQRVGKEIHLIDYYENSGEGLEHYINVLEEKAKKNGWKYGKHIAPHDVRNRQLAAGGFSTLQVAERLGLRFEIAPSTSISGGIEAVRWLFKYFWFDEEKCKIGITMLKNYRKDYDEVRKTYKERPVHDYASHGSDSMRMLAITYRGDMRGSVSMMPRLGADLQVQAGVYDGMTFDELDKVIQEQRLYTKRLGLNN
jgi:phage terminase large subunit